MPLSDNADNINNEFFALTCKSMADEFLKKRGVDRYIVAAGLYSEAIKCTSPEKTNTKSDLIGKLAYCLKQIPSHIPIDLGGLSPEIGQAILLRKRYSKPCKDLLTKRKPAKKADWSHCPMSMEGIDASLLIDKANYFFNEKVRSDRYIIAAGLYSEAIRCRPFITSIIGLYECFKRIPSNIQIDLRDLPLPPVRDCGTDHNLIRQAFMKNLFTWTLSQSILSEKDKEPIQKALLELQAHCFPPPTTVETPQPRHRRRKPRPILPSAAPATKATNAPVPVQNPIPPLGILMRP